MVEGHKFGEWLPGILGDRSAEIVDGHESHMQFAFCYPAWTLRCEPYEGARWYQRV